ncbi:MAG: glycosyltransferase [Terrimicrobiaceae bacterium]|nr:glycosyltransferase [Terrimicrobiaceae bacterium]
MRPLLFFSGAAHRALDPQAVAASGGAELQTALLARELAAGGRPCVLAASGGGFPDGIVWSGVRVRDAGCYHTGAPAATAAALPRVVRVLGEERPSHVVVYGWTSWLLVLALLRPFFGFRLVYVCALDGEVDGRFARGHPLRRWMFLAGLRAADARLAITETMAAALRARGLSCAGVTRLLIAPAPERRNLEKIHDLLWVARCHPVKRPRLFLSLARRFPSARCRMICSPQDAGLFEEIRREAAELPNLEFCEGLPYSRIQEAFDAARVFVNTSEDEGMPNTFVQSGLARAAIASLQADPDRLIEKFGAGIPAVGDFSVLEKGIGTLLADPAALARAAAGSARFVSEWHDNARNVRAFLTALP